MSVAYIRLKNNILTEKRTDEDKQYYGKEKILKNIFWK